MTIRQKFLQTVYPAYVRLSRISPNKSRVVLKADIHPPVSFYSLQGTLRDGTMLNFSTLSNKKVLLVNTASGCGFTEQYDQLQQLYTRYTGQLVIIACPTNDFGEEKLNDEEIAIFCQENFRVSFPILQKSVVKKGSQQNPIFRWLTQPLENGWNSQPPLWNFCKYLVNEKGLLTGYFGSAVEPIGPFITSAIEAGEQIERIR